MNSETNTMRSAVGLAVVMVALALAVSQCEDERPPLRTTVPTCEEQTVPAGFDTLAGAETHCSS